MIDVIEKIGKGSVIQHGKLNDRIYLMKLAEADSPYITELLEKCVQQYRYAKIFGKIPSRSAPLFLASGYLMEGYIPSFYNGGEDCLFVSRFLTPDRARPLPAQSMRRLFELLQTSLDSTPVIESNPEYSIRPLGREHADCMTSIYTEVFKSYPFPIHDPEYLIKTMDDHIQYFGAFKGERLAALASSEIDRESQSAEMTDFATHPQHTGHSLSRMLLAFMEHSMKQQDIRTLYTIARLNSIPMNKTFLKSGYRYSGTLLNNTQIAGSIESMNIYYKRL